MSYKLPMNYKPLVSMIDSLEGELDEQESVLLAAALLTWQHLGQCQRVNANSALTPALAISPRSASQVLLGLAQELGLEPFETAAKLLDNISQRTATEVLQATLRTQEQGNLGNFDPSDIAAVTQGMRRSGMRFLPAAVCDLMSSLALDGADAQASIYLPWDASGQLLGRCLKSGRTAAMETPHGNFDPNFVSWMRALIHAYFEWPMKSQLVSGDPIRSPAYQDKGTLRKFDLVMATPPFGGRSDQWDPTLDVFERFPDKTSSLTVLAIRHVIAQTAGRAVIAVTNSVLFSSGGERRLRKDLLDAGVVQAVIGLPNGLLADSNIPFALLVLDKHQRHETVRFVNCDSAHFKEAESRTRFTLKSIHDIVELALGRASGPDSADVRREDLQQTEWNLLPSRHVIDAGMNLVDKVMGQYATVSLEEIAEVLRPLAETAITDPIDVLEVGAADIQGSGFIATPTKAITVSKARTKGGAVFLQPGDIVFVIKGSVGKVSIAPEDTPPVGPGGWVVGQSVAVVRINKPQTYRMAMTVFFRSDIGQELLRRLAAGATIPFLQIRELRQLRVPTLNAEEVEQAARVLTDQEVLRRQILDLQIALGRLKFEPWSSTDTGVTTGWGQ
jgi:type I restriction enzyme M protein